MLKGSWFLILLFFYFNGKTNCLLLGSYPRSVESFCPLLQGLLRLTMSGAKPAVFSAQHPVPRFLVLNTSFIRSRRVISLSKNTWAKSRKFVTYLLRLAILFRLKNTDIVLVGLSQDFDSVVSVASFSPEPLALDRLMEILLECERR